MLSNGVDLTLWFHTLCIVLDRQGFLLSDVGFTFSPMDNSSGACAHKLSFGQIRINASDTRCLLSHNEEWNASTLES